ncbi:class I glutamine amidotransferase-like protein [Kockovaella imperatae]|uniref:Class I glutamine amidotransferase-like protein n=1 Tax=Kockovaella imperatae TaxID=4999 RepID=A0A1Y1UT69_9TREE|nr:class I glutamine amidotransferase-like protein [Kockovaella imperatae]ORX41210.1 class I glutamine amidotransferase-like protein [Kockovaella imperatae]
MSSQPRIIRVVLPLFPYSQPLDWCGPHAVFSSTDPSRPASRNLPFNMIVKIASETMDPVMNAGGLRVVPDMTLEEAESETWDAILLPGGGGARPWLKENDRVQEFLKNKVPEVEYVWTVCTGSWLLASTGLLRGLKATTNKAAYNEVIETTQDQGVTWVPEARWVVDGKIWSSSGVTAGIDMAAAIIRHLLSKYENDQSKAKQMGDQILAVLEVK